MWSVKCGVWSVKCGVWSVKCRVWSVKWEVWSVKCGVRSVECRVWSVQWVKCGVWIPIEISKIVRGHSSDPHFLDRNFPPSQFPSISWRRSKRSFMILYVTVPDHFLEREGLKEK